MLELKNISYIVEDEKEIIKDVSLSISEGFIAITGPNGGGKQTQCKKPQILCDFLHFWDYMCIGCPSHSTFDAAKVQLFSEICK